MERIVQSIVQREISNVLLYALIALMLYYGGTKLLSRYENDSRSHMNANWCLANNLNNLGEKVGQLERYIEDVEYDLKDEFSKYISDNVSDTSSISSISEKSEKLPEWSDGEPV